jgi:hypothetical protein
VTERRFAFVQWEFPGRLGPPPGRYPVRRYAGDEVREIVVIGGLDAPRGGARRGRRAARAVASEPGPEAVEVTRATVIDAAPLAGEDAAAAWLADAAGPSCETVLAGALVTLNRAVAGYRVAAADPYVADADGARAIATRVGYGSGEEVADGRWEEARELGPPAGARRVASPDERLAALLGGRDVALACEELALRARADLDHGRGREAAMQAHLALEAAIAELEGWRGRGDMGSRVDELVGHRDAVASAANEALAGGLSEASTAAVAEALGRVEAALRAKAALG